MPIEIRELVIKTTVSDRSDEDATSHVNHEVQTKAIISSCVEKVMEMLKEKEER